MTKKIRSSKQAAKKKTLRLIFQDIFGTYNCGLHLVFVRKKSEIVPYLKAIGCDDFYFFDTSKAGAAQEGSTICFWGDRRNRKFDYNEVIAKKYAYVDKEKRVFLFTNVGKAKLEREFPCFCSVSSVIGEKKLSLNVEKCQAGPCGIFPLS